MLSLTQNILKVVGQQPVIAQYRGGTGNPCALTEFGCTGTFVDDRTVAILPDGTRVGTCADWQRHAEIARQAGPGSDAQTIFNWVINTFRIHNPQIDENGNRIQFKDGVRPPNNVLDLRSEKAKERAAKAEANTATTDVPEAPAKMTKAEAAAKARQVKAERRQAAVA